MIIIKIRLPQITFLRRKGVNALNKKKRPTISQDTYDKVKEMLINEPKSSYRVIAKKCGVGRSLVHKIKVKEKIKRPNNKGGWYARHPQETHDKVVKLYNDNVTKPMISKLLNLKIESVESMIGRYRRYGVSNKKPLLYSRVDNVNVPTSVGKRVILYALERPKMSRDEIAKYFGYHHSTIRTLLKIANITRKLKKE